MTNGLFLQRETVPQLKQDLIDWNYNNQYSERNQANILFFFKKMGSHLNVQKRNVTGAMSETDLYGKVCGFMMIAL